MRAWNEHPSGKERKGAHAVTSHDFGTIVFFKIAILVAEQGIFFFQIFHTKKERTTLMIWESRRSGGNYTSIYGNY